jgi:tRNA-2-methylthio-N6-dimethylallyladenosine synthase
MNEHDSEKMSMLLEGIGLSPVPAPERADVIIINTCSIREKAEHKVYSALGKLKSLKVKNPHLVTVVSGCVAQQEKDRLLKRANHLDCVLGTHCIDELPVLLQHIRKTGDRLSKTEFSHDVGSLHVQAPVKGRSPVCSHVTIMQGCSNFCSYCVVPLTRGPEQSRPIEEILQEVRTITQKSVKEITLLGQNVNAYRTKGDAHATFADLLVGLDRIPQLCRIRFTTSHPRDFSEDLIGTMAELKTVCEHVHLPLQAGSDRILRAMRRGYSLDGYLKKIAKLRGMIPGVAITSDIMVGFPGETEDDFSQTFEALREIRFDQIFSFKYSVRPGTLAESLPEQVPEEEKIQRLAEIQALQDQITESYNRLAEATEEEVLIEGIRPRSGQPFGRTRTNKVVNVDPTDEIDIGDVIRVKIMRGLKHSLVGRKVL